jgi:hypothetical protein
MQPRRNVPRLLPRRRTPAAVWRQLWNAARGHDHRWTAVDDLPKPTDQKAGVRSLRTAISRTRAVSAQIRWHPWLMQLNSSDGVSVDLRIAGYECPGVIDSEWGANWLQVCGHITLADGRAWAFEHPSLTTWEARELGDWLREVAAGTVPPSLPGSGKFG